MQAASASPTTTAGDLELPVATQGTEQWAGVVAKAMTAGGMDHGTSLQALQAFKTAVAAKMAKTVRHPCFLKLLFPYQQTFLL